MALHYAFGGSTAGRTVKCPAWHNLAKNMPSGPPSLAAMEGTLMHLLFERGVADPDFEPAEMLGEMRIIDGQELHVTEAHIDKVYTALDCLEDIRDEYAYDFVLPEVIMNTDDETGGTADIIAFSTLAGIRVTAFGVHDLKTGDGHMVSAENNEQLLFYAWQAVEKFKKELAFNEETKFQLGIIQPSDRRDSPVDIWNTDLKTILDFGKTYKQAQKMAKAGIIEPCAGSHCAYCPAMSTCPAKTGMIQVSQRIPSGSTELADLIKAMSIVDDVEDWCKAVRKTAHEQLEQGVNITGFKLVPKRATRVWNDPQKALQKFKRARGLTAEDYLDMKLKSAPQMEKVCKAKGVDFKKFESMISLHSSGTTLVKDSDPRPAALPLKSLAAMAAQIKK
jgi:hypothetical protein